MIYGAMAALALLSVTSQCSGGSDSTNESKLSYNESIKLIGLEETVKGTGIRLDDVIKIYELLNEVYNDDMDKERVKQITQEAYDIELKIIHEKIKLIVGDNKHISVYESYNGRTAIKIDGEIIYKNWEIPEPLRKAIHAAASVDKDDADFYHYNQDDQINEIKVSLMDVINIILDRIYINDKGKLEEDEAPYIIDGKIDDENVKNYLNEGYTTYAYDMYGNIVPVIKDGKYIGCETYDNPYIELEEYLKEIKEGNMIQQSNEEQNDER